MKLHTVNKETLICGNGRKCESNHWQLQSTDNGFTNCHSCPILDTVSVITTDINTAPLSQSHTVLQAKEYNNNSISACITYVQYHRAGIGVFQLLTDWKHLVILRTRVVHLCCNVYLVGWFSLHDKKVHMVTEWLKPWCNPNHQSHMPQNQVSISDIE